MKSEPVLVRDKVDGDTEVAEASGTPDSVQVRLGHLREIEVDHDVHSLDVDTTREEIYKVEDLLVPCATL